jgi:ER membrane protein SH3
MPPPAHRSPAGRYRPVKQRAFASAAILATVAAFVTAPAGFLLAVLWFDLMFDVQVLGRGRRSGQLPEDVLASIAAYYARVTTRARPMNRLIAVVMIAALAAVVVQIAKGDDPRWVAWTSLPLALLAIGVAAAHTVPAAVRLGARSDPIAEQSRLARSILRDHVLCFAAIATLLALQLAFTA